MMADDESEGGGITPIEAARARDRARADTGVPAGTGTDAQAEVEPRLWSPADMALEITRRSAEKWIPLEIGGTTVVSVPLGEIVVLVGPTGSGKSTLALAIAVAHARDRGPVMYISCEMPPAFIGGRVVGQVTDHPWPEVLRGAVDTSAMTDAMPARFYVVDRTDALGWQRAAKALAARHPAEPLVVIVDYLQILPALGEPRDMRARVAESVDDISAWAIEARALVLVVSQTSRAAARALRSGESVGWSATDAGAESASIERAAHLVLAIGERGPDQEDGSCEVTLSIGKHRMGRGDQVLQTAYHGENGRWRALGTPRRADVAKAERDAEKGGRRIATAAVAVADALAKASAPMSRIEVRSAIEMNKQVTCAAIAQLLEARTIVEVELPDRRARGLWTPARARKAKLRIVGDSVETGEPDLSSPDGATP